MEGQINNYEGMNKDVGYDVIPNNLYIDAKDIRITTVSGESQGSFTNMKGTTEYFTIPTEGEYLGNSWFAVEPRIIGYTTIRNRIIVFVADDSGTKGWIYDIQYNPATRNILPGFPNLILYGPNVGFNKINPIEAIGRYESEKIQKVYWTDYNNQLRSYNIELPPTIYSDNIIDFHNKVIFYTPMLAGISSGGSLLVGSYQVAYKYRTIDGKETLISPPSELIHITSSSEGNPGTSSYVGDISTVNSTKAIKININIDTNNILYDEIDIFLIYHSQVIGNPSVKFIETQKISTSNNNISVLITGNENGIYEIDYNDYITRTYPFYTAKTLTPKDNDLVIANLKTKSFSAADRIAELGETFDFKILRFNENGQAAADEFNQKYNLDAHWLQDWHDYDQYKYKINGTTLGGQSNNIILDFVLQPTMLDTNYDDTPLVNINNIESVIVDTDLEQYYSNNLLDGYGQRINNTYNNLASPFLSGVIRGYKRGETYRFGIIFYNAFGECSFVEHIGDIKFPDISEETDTDNDTPINTHLKYNFPYATSPISNPNRIVGYNLGFKLTIDFSTCPQFYSEITGYQIVRVERTVNDARRVSSGSFKIFTNVPSGAPITATDFDLRLPAINSNIYHLSNSATNDPNAIDDGRLSGFHNMNNASVQINVPRIRDFIAYHSPEISYEYNNIHTAIENSTNACLLITGWIVRSNINPRLSSTFTAATGLPIKANDRTTKFHSTAANDFANTKPTEYIKRWLSKQFIKMDDSPDLIYTCGAGPFSSVGINRFYLRNYHVAINTTTQAHFNDPQAPNAANNNDFTFSKGATGILGNIGKLLLDPITQQSIPITSNVEYWDTNFVGPEPSQVGYAPVYIDYSCPIIDTVLPKEEIYGGYTQSALENNIFRICSPFIEKSNLTPKVFGGDIFLNMFTLQTSCIDFNLSIYKNNGTNSYAYGQSNSTTVAFPIESWINLELDYGASIRRGVAYTFTNGSNIEEKQVLRQETNNTLIGYAKSPNMYKQNDVFSITNNNIAFSVKPVDFNLSEINDVRSRLSDTKSNGELTDSWTKFETTRFYDVDDYGPINKLINWRDIVYFFQDKGVGIHAINRTAVSSATDGTPLQLGTSLGFSKHQYLTKEHGSIHQWAIKATDQGIYYIDALSRKIFKIGEGNTPITELLGMHSWMQTLPANVFTLKQNGGDNPILNSGIIIARDKINDEIVFTFLSPETKYSLVFDELAQKFSSLYTPTPNIWIENNDILLSSLNGKVHLHNSGNYGEFYGTVTEAKLSLIVNPKSDYNKVLRFLEFNSIVRDNNKVIDRTKTITAFRIQTQYQDTGKVLFSPDRFKRKFDKWRLKIPRNQSSSSQHDRLRSTYFIVTLYFDNTYNKELIMNHLLSYYDIQVF